MSDIFGEPSKSFSIEQEARKYVDITWDSPFHTIGRGSTQAAAGNHTHDEFSTKRYSRYDLSVEKALTANTQSNLLLDLPRDQFSVTTPAVGTATVGTAPNQYTEMTFLAPGLYNVRFEVDLAHATVGKEDLFVMQGSGDGTNWVGHIVGVKQLIANQPQRPYGVVVVVEAEAEDKLVVAVKPVGTGATGWKVTWAGVYIWQWL